MNPRKGITALEFRDQIALVSLLDRFKNPRWEFTHLPMGEKRSVWTGRKLKLMGTRKGWPDFIFVRDDGRTFWLELKRRYSGKLTKEQGVIIPFLMRAGHGVLVTNSLDEAVATLQLVEILNERVRLQ